MGPFSKRPGAFVKMAQSSRAPIQDLTDKISGIFVPVVTILAIDSVTFTHMPFGTSGLHRSIFREVCRGGFSINRETKAMKTDSEKT